MDALGDDWMPDFARSDAARAQLEAAAEQYVRGLGYEPPPSPLDPDRVLALLSADRDSADAMRPVSPHEAARVRETSSALIDELEHVEPRELEFDPFVGEADGGEHRSVHGIRAVLRSESFVATVAAEANHVRAQVVAMRPDIDAARRVVEERDRERAELEARARANFAHAKQHADALAQAADDDAMSVAGQLQLRYVLDAVNAKGEVESLQAGRQLDGLHEAVATLGDSVGDVSDAAHLSYAAATAKRRRRRRVRRNLVRLVLAALIAAVTFGIDLLWTGTFWVVAGPAALALVAFAVDPLIDRWFDLRTRRSQLRDLADAVLRSEQLLGRLLEREAQLNGVRAIRGLPPVRVVRRSTLDRPAVGD